MEAKATNPQDYENGIDSHSQFSAPHETEKDSVNGSSQSQTNNQIDATSPLRRCRSCNNGNSSFMRKGHTQYRCDTCKLLVNGKNRICKNHPQAGTYPNNHPEKRVTRSCHVCHGTGFLQSRPVIPAVTIGTTIINNVINNADSSSRKSTATPDMAKTIDTLQKTIKFDRKFMRIISDTSGNPLKLIKAVVQHIKRYQPKAAIKAFRQAWLPTDVMEEIPFYPRSR